MFHFVCPPGSEQGGPSIEDGAVVRHYRLNVTGHKCICRCTESYLALKINKSQGLLWKHVCKLASITLPFNLALDLLNQVHASGFAALVQRNTEAAKAAQDMQSAPVPRDHSPSPSEDEHPSKVGQTRSRGGCYVHEATHLDLLNQVHASGFAALVPRNT